MTPPQVSLVSAKSLQLPHLPYYLEENPRHNILSTNVLMCILRDKDSLLKIIKTIYISETRIVSCVKK